MPVATRRFLAASIGVLFLATVVGMAVLWPSGDSPVNATADFPGGLIRAKVQELSPVCTRAGQEADIGCQVVSAQLVSGSREGEVVEFELGDGSTPSPLEPGDRIVVAQAPEAPEGQQFYFTDRDRRLPLTVLAVVFALCVVALGRLRGLAALAGFALSLSILAYFILPALLEGSNPLAVCIVGAAAVTLVGLYVAHGVTVQTTTALLGTLASLLITALLAFLFVKLGRFSGLSSEEATFLNISASQVNLEGLLLGGIIIGALGVLDDVTITQTSAVWELKAANPGLDARGLYRSALRIGRDHIASTVNTLVLAYAGASLPLLILFSVGGLGLGDVLNGEVVAEEVVRTLVGSVGLVASVPITTALAAAIVTRSRPPSSEADRRNPST
ncbi:MAG: YibE/F family protein [Actinomycetota bacterium]